MIAIRLTAGGYHLQQSFFLTKIALNIFHKNCPTDCIAVILKYAPVDCKIDKQS